MGEWVIEKEIGNVSITHTTCKNEKSFYLPRLIYLQSCGCGSCQIFICDVCKKEVPKHIQFQAKLLL